MIAGETERILSRGTGVEQYDNFSFFRRNKNGKSKKIKTVRKTKKTKKNKEELSPEEQDARRMRRQKIWSTIGTGLREGGNVIELFNGRSQNTQNIQPAPQDFQINLGDEDGLSSSGADQEKEKEEEDKKGNGIPTPALIIGGVLVLGVIYLGYLNYQSSQESNRLQS